MSAFSDWNGPQGGGGTTLPQVKTLEELIIQIQQVASNLAQLRTAYDGHVSDQTGQTKHNNLSGNGWNAGDTLAALRAAVNQAQATATALAGSGNTDTLRSLRDSINANNASINAGLTTEVANRQNGDNLNTTAIASETAARQTLDTRLTAAIASLTNQIKATFGTTIFTDNPGNQQMLEIQQALKILDLTCGNIKAAYMLDFTQWKLVTAQYSSAYNLTFGETNDRNLTGFPVIPVYLIGTLSKDWSGALYKPDPDKQTHKASRAYIKYVNTRPWNAIIDMSATIDPALVGDAAYTGGISGLASMTDNRVNPIPPFKMRGLRFGLYHGTTATGKEHIYLGVTQDDLGLQAGPTGTTLVNSVQFYVAGINFKPLSPDEYTSAAVSQIVTADMLHDGVVYSEISANIVYSDNYYDKAGNKVLVTDPINETLTLGDPNAGKQLNVYSKDRPSVFHTSGDTGEHKVAYLTDMTASAYWQQSVDALFATLAEANAALVTTDGNGKILTWDATSANNKPGIYFSDPMATNPTGQIFELDALILIQDSLDISNNLADLKVSVDISTGTAAVPVQVPSSAFSPIDLLTYVKQGTTSGAPNGTIVEYVNPVDGAKYFGKIVSVPSGAVTTYGVMAVSAPWHEYKLPAYAVFDGTTFNKTQDIAVPGTFDQQANRITYEWSGPAALANTGSATVPPQFNESTIDWTAQYGNNDTMIWGMLKEWSVTNLRLDAYRTSASQDVIDLELQSLATIQSDWAEDETITVFEKQGFPDQIVANPAYIHHKPWTGVGLLDGGNFKEPYIADRWYVDGGDFTGVAEAVQDAQRGIAYTRENNFKNVVIRLWHGFYSDMPDNPDKMPAPSPAVIQTYAYTLRWIDAVAPATRDELHASNGTGEIFRFIPFNSFVWDNIPDLGIKRSVMQQVASHVFTPTVWSHEVYRTDFQAINSPVSHNSQELVSPDSVTRPIRTAFPLPSDGLRYNTYEANATVEIPTVPFDDLQQVIISSPRMAAIEQDIATLAEWADEVRSEVFNEPVGTGTESTVADGTVPPVRGLLARALALEEAVYSTTIGNQKLRDDLDAEVARAEAAEQVLRDDLAAEVARAEAAEAAEQARAEAAEQVLRDDLAAEVARAEAAEAAEQARAEAAEQVLRDDLAAEVTRATAAEQAVATDLAAEVTRATAAEQAVATDLAAEVTRATAAEQAVATALTIEISNREVAVATEGVARGQADTALGQATVALGVRIDGNDTAIAALDTKVSWMTVTIPAPTTAGNLHWDGAAFSWV